MKKRIIWLFVLPLLISCSAEKNENQESVNETPAVLKVAAVNYPLAFFAETIGGEKVEVFYPVPGDVDPAYWEPNIEQITEYQNADLILLNGAGYAKWVEKVSLPYTSIVNTSLSFVDEYIEEEGVSHSHGDGEEHSHAEVAFTTWLDFSLASKQARSVMEALSKKKPEQRNYFQENFNKLESTLVELQTQLTESMSGKTFYGSHPVYQYLAKGTGSNIYSVHWEPGEDIDNEQWHELEHLIEEHGAHTMLWEGEPSAATHERLSGAGINVVVFQTGGSKPETGDLTELLKGNIEALGMINE